MDRGKKNTMLNFVHTKCGGKLRIYMVTDKLTIQKLISKGSLPQHHPIDYRTGNISKITNH
jgi:hypothetical protein